MERLPNNTVQRLVLAGGLLAATACINFINVQVHVVMPELANKTRVTRTATVSEETDKDIEELLKAVDIQVTQVARNED